MDVLEILVLLIALVLIFLVVAVVLVVGQAMASKKEEEGDAESSHAESESTPDSKDPLIQPAESIPPVEEEEVVASAQVADDKVEISQAQVAMEAAAVAAASSASVTAEAVMEHAQPSVNMATSHYEQSHRVHEERHVDSDRHNQYNRHGDGISDDEIRRPAVEAGNTRVSQQDENFPYMSGGPLLSPIERLFYGDLKTSVSDKTEIFTKVRASDVINPKADLSFEEAQFAAEQLATQRFDFVLCDSKDFSVLCVIELDGLSEREGLRKIQREILRKAAESANVPVLLVDMKRGYTIKEIKDRVGCLIPKETEGFVAESHLGHNKRKIADLITEVDEPVEAPSRHYVHSASAFEEVENNSIHQFGNASHQHQRPQPEEFQPQYSAPTGSASNGRSQSFNQTTPDTGSHTPSYSAFQESFQQSAPGRDVHQPEPQPPTSAYEASHVHPTPDPAAFAEGTSTKCPRCSAPLKMSMATTGEFAGRYFWICTKLPECPYVAPITPPE